MIGCVTLIDKSPKTIFCGIFTDIGVSVMSCDLKGILSEVRNMATTNRMLADFILHKIKTSTDFDKHGCRPVWDF